MKKAFYFSHDSNAHRDEQILMLRAEHGWEGYGLYWALVEMMFESSDTTLHHDNIKGLALNFNTDITLLQSVITTCITHGLFESDDEVFWSESLVRRKEKLQESRRKKSEAGKKGMAKRWASKGDQDNGVITNDNTVITENNKVKESKVNNKERRKSPTYDESSIHFVLAKRLYEKILVNNPNHKKPNLQKWADDVRLMMERDGRTEDQIRYLIDWSQNNSFWKSNILSTRKLRDQFDQLTLQVKSEKEKVAQFPKQKYKDEPARPNVQMYKPFDFEKAMAKG